MEANEILKQMVDAAPIKVVSNTTSLQTIDTETAALTEQANAIKTGMMDIIASDLDTYLRDMWDISGGDFSIIYGPTFNQNAPTGTLTDWQVTDSTTGDIVYQYGGIGWDGDVQIIEYVTNWNWALDYLWREMGFTGTYGIYDKIEKLNAARGVIQSDLNKYAASIEQFTPFAST